MKMKIWLFCVAFFMLFVAPALLIMMLLVAGDMNPGEAVLWWIPIASLVAVGAYFWFYRLEKKREKSVSA